MSLSAQSVSFAVKGRALVHQISLTVTPGELVVVLGPNGAGKSTLLRLLAGEIAPSEGTIHLGKRQLSAWPALERARRLAVLPQQTVIPFTLPAWEIALLGRAPHVGHPSSAHDHAITAAAMEATGVLALAARAYPSLSGGEKARVQLARVLAQIWEPVDDSPRILLLDEPSAALDYGHQHQLLRLAREWARAGVGVLAILHDLNLAAQYADRVAILREGRLLATGAPAEVFTPATIQAAFDWPASVIPHPQGGWPVVLAAHA